MGHFAGDLPDYVRNIMEISGYHAIYIYIDVTTNMVTSGNLTLRKLENHHVSGFYDRTKWSLNGPFWKKPCNKLQDLQEAIVHFQPHLGWLVEMTNILYFLAGLKTIKKRISYEHVEQKQEKNTMRKTASIFVKSPRCQDLVPCLVPPSPGEVSIGAMSFCHSSALRESHMSKALFFGGDLKNMKDMEDMELWVWSPRQFPCQNGQVKFCWHSVQFLCWKHELKTG